MYAFPYRPAFAVSLTYCCFVCVLAAMCAMNSQRVYLSPTFLLSCILISVVLISYGVRRFFIHSPIRARAWISHIQQTALCFGLAYFVFDIDIQNRIDQQLPSYLENNTLRLIGEVDSIESSGEYTRFLFIVKSSEVLSKSKEKSSVRHAFNGRVRLSWRQPVDRPSVLIPGQILQLDARLKRPRGFVVPKGFDYQRWLLSQGIHATGYVREIHELRVSQHNSIFSLPKRWREQVKKSVSNKLGVFEHQGLILALLAGDKTQVSQNEWRLFQDTGTIHLMAISGLHVGMIAGGVAFLARYLLMPLVLIVHPLWSRTIVLCLSLGAAFLYAGLAGFSVPTLRAVLCVFFVGVFCLLGRRIDFLAVLSFVALCLLFSNPFFLLKPGFVLSFVAVAVLVWTFQNKIGRRRFIYNFIKVQIVLLVLLFPFQSALNLPISSVSPIANSIAVPLISLLILPLIFIGVIVSELSTPLAMLCWGMADWVLDLLMAILEYISKPAFYFSARPFTLLVVLLSVFFIGLHRSIGLRVYAGCVLLAAMSYALQKETEERLSLSVLDVGQGLSVVVDDGRHVLIYDIGAQFSESFSIARRVLLPYLLTLGERSSYTAVISHADMDHSGDLDAFIAALKQATGKSIRVWTGEPAELGLSREHLCRAGQVLTLSESTTFQVLWPNDDTEHDQGAAYDGNNQSCVLLMQHHDTSVLFMGDVEKSVEWQLLFQDQLPSHVDVLIAGHHGSNTSSTAAFIEHVRPKHVIYSAGYKNRYRHPSAKVQARFDQYENRQWNTALHGTLSVKIDQAELVVSSARCSNPKRWFLDEGQCVNQASSQHDALRYD